MSKKVRCSFCLNEKDGFCSVKKVKVKGNKPRLCEGYIFEESKVKPKKPVNVTRVPAGRAVDKNRVLRELAQSGDPKHPLTGDLSRFTTTAGKKED